MNQKNSCRCVLVPVLGGDITPAALALATRAIAVPGARLAIMHIVCGRTHAHRRSRPATAGTETGIPRWRRLAGVLPPERVFVDTVRGDPARVIPAQARRFGCDAIVLGRPAWSPAHAERFDPLASRLLGVLSEQLVIAVDGERTPRGALASRSSDRTTALPSPC